MDINSPFLVLGQTSDGENQGGCCCSVLPVSAGTDFILTNANLQDNFTFYLTDLAGNIIGNSAGYAGTGKTVDLSNIDLSAIMAPDDCFRIKTGDELSNVFQYIGCNTENTLLFEFWDEDSDVHQSIRLRCIINNPQAKTDKSEYEDLNGHVWSLSKKRRKNYDLTTDFYPDSIHDSIREMLTYPNLTVDDVLMYETGDYEVNWDDKDENGDAMGTTKLSEQEIERFLNCL
ncbi:MAG: hypothetical protein LBR64_02220 [Dysgonamonadaceae bacterium]|jgi:hypothetical protein|nr:hypothetical protein [Dysgonamonadaceae bacterium]